MHLECSPPIRRHRRLAHHRQASCDRINRLPSPGATSHSGTPSRRVPFTGPRRHFRSSFSRSSTTSSRKRVATALPHGGEEMTTPLPHRRLLSGHRLASAKFYLWLAPPLRRLNHLVDHRSRRLRPGTGHHTGCRSGSPFSNGLRSTSHVARGGNCPLAPSHRGLPSSPGTTFHSSLRSRDFSLRTQKLGLLPDGGCSHPRPRMRSTGASLGIVSRGPHQQAVSRLSQLSSSRSRFRNSVLCVHGTPCVLAVLSRAIPERSHPPGSGRHRPRGSLRWPRLCGPNEPFTRLGLSQWRLWTPTPWVDLERMLLTDFEPLRPTDVFWQQTPLGFSRSPAFSPLEEGLKSMG